MTTVPTPQETPSTARVSRSALVISRCRVLLERRPDLRGLPLAGVVLAEGAGSA